MVPRPGLVAWALVWLGLWMLTVPVGANTTTAPDAATTDDRIPVLIDVVANDADSLGRPLVVQVTGHDCPGRVDDLGDGSLLFVPDELVLQTELCTIDHTVNGVVSSVALTVVPGSGSTPLTCGGDWGTGVFQPAGSNFEYQGQPIDLAGYYPGMHTFGKAQLDSQPPQSSSYYQQAIDTLADRNINLVRIFLTTFTASGNHGGQIAPYEQHPTLCCTASPPSGSGVSWVGGNLYDLDRFNDAFFDHWNQVLSYARQRGVMVILPFFETRLTWSWDNIVEVVPGQAKIAAGRKYSLLASTNNVNGVAIDHETSPADWYSEPAALERQTAFVREAARRLGGHPNVLWELSNEPPIPSRLDPTILAAWQAQICTALREGELAGNHPRHAVMQVDLPEHRDVPGATIPGHPDTPGTNADYRQLHADLVADYGAGNGPPLISDNDCCFDDGTAERQRKKAWTTMISGAHPLLFDYKADEEYGSLLTDSNTQTAITWVGRVRELIGARNLDLTTMVPRDDLVATSGDTWLRATEGGAHIAYFLTPGTATLSGLPTSWQAEWFEPRSGAFAAANPASGTSTSATFSTPACGDFSPSSPACNGASDWVLVVSPDGGGGGGATGQIPWGGVPWPVGVGHGPIEAEDFDQAVDDLGNGVLGQDETYFDSTQGNAAGSAGLRTDEWVDTFATAPAHVGGTTDGEWLEYTVDVEAAGPYALHLIYATHPGAGDGVLAVEVYDGSILESRQTLVLASTDNGTGTPHWRAFTHCQPADLAAGQRVVRLVFEQATFDLDKFQLLPADNAQAPYGGTPRGLPGVLEAEHFDSGATAGYCDFTPENLGPGFRPEEWVDVSVGAAGPAIAWNPAGEWLEYSVEVTTAGIHEVSINYSTLAGAATGQGRITVLDGAVVDDSLTFDLPPNGDPGPWDDLEVGTLDLGVGARQVRFEVLASGFAWNRMQIGQTAPPVEPPVAADDSFEVPLGSTLTLPAAALLANDEPRDAVEIDPDAPLVSGPALGAVVWDAVGERFLVTSDPATTTVQYFEYGIRRLDAPGATDVGRVALIPVASAPVAYPDAFVLPPGTSLRIRHVDLTRNDTGLDIGFDQLVTTTPGLEEVSSTELRYTPPAGTTQAQFQYRAVDFFGTPSNPTTVTLTVSPTAGRPVANDDAFVMAQRNLDGTRARLTIYWADVFANDVAVSGGTLEIAGERAATHGDLVVGGANGWDYFPEDANWQGTDDFGYLVAENGLTADAFADVFVTVVPAPDGADDSLQTGFDTPRVIEIATELLGNDSGYGLDLRLLSGSLVGPSHGSLDTSVPGLLTYVPNPGFSGSDSFTYIAANTLDGVRPEWATRSNPVTVTVLVDPPDAMATDDVVLVHPAAQQVSIPRASLWANDWPSNELVLVSLGTPELGSLDQVGDVLRYTPSSDFERFGRDAFTYTVRRFGGNPNVAPTATVHLLSEAAYSTALADDFEGTDLSAWDGVVETGNHRLTLTSSAALTGLQGLEVSIDQAAGGTSAYVASAAMTDASHTSLSFGLDPSGLTMAEGSHHPIVYSAQGTLQLRRQAGGFEVRQTYGDDLGVSRNTGWWPLSGGAQDLRVEWAAASAPGWDDGFATLWIDRVLVAEATGLDTDRQRAGEIRLGVIWGLDPGTDGTMVLDHARLQRGSGDLRTLLADDFDGPGLAAWNPPVESGGTVSQVADPTGGQRLAIQVAGAGSKAHLVSPALEPETHLVARFELDPGTLVLPEGERFFLFTGSRPGALTTDLRFQTTAGQLQLALYALRDDGTAIRTPWVDVPPGRHEVALEWWAASGPGSADGGARLHFDEVLVGELNILDNDRQFVESLSLGAVTGVDAGTTGTFYFDSFDAWQGPTGRQPLLFDDFTTGIDPRWLDVVAPGSGLSVEPVAALGGSAAARFQLPVGGGGSALLRHETLDHASRYRARFRLFLDTLKMAEGDTFQLFSGVGDAGLGLQLKLRFNQGAYQLALVVYQDDGSTQSTGYQSLGDGTAVHDLELAWWTASGPTQADGGAQLWLDDTLVGTLDTLDNDLRTLERIDLGAVGGVDTGTSGTFDLDDFSSWR